MTRQRKTQLLIDAAHLALTQHRPQTVRQIFYHLVATHLVANTRNRYKAVCRALVAGRKDGTIPWHWIEDRLRRPRKVPMWHDVAHYATSCKTWYRRNVWTDQPRLVEVWLEKDALSGIFEDILEPFGVTLNVGRGYDGWSSIHEAAARYARWQPAPTILYFGDFDPSGRDMARSLEERISFFGTSPNLKICAILRSHIEDFNLPPDFTKSTDSRQPAFVLEHGDISVELDALPIEILRGCIRGAIDTHLDLDALQET
ncbi:unnamed protein product, partial [marine sediment metagenome]